MLLIAENIRKAIKKTSNISNPDQLQLNEDFIKNYDSSEFDIADKTITEYSVELLNEIKAKGSTSIKEVRQKFYPDKIVKLKKLVINYLSKSGKMLYLNIDGLDSNLDIHKNKRIISLILYNLHEVCSTLLVHIAENYSINLFLRTDLYLTFKDRITEKDKITKLFFSWQPDYLIQIINYRLKENNINHIADLLHDDLNIDSLMQKIEKFIYDRPRDYVYLFNSFVQIAQSLKKNKIDNKVFNEALEYYVLHLNESLEAEFLSLQFDLSYGLLLTNLKERMQNEITKIRV